MNKTAVIDYDAGNTDSVIKALEFLGQDVILSADPAILADADRIILPGVGAFYDAMCKLDERGLIETIKKLVSTGVPFLGICLGMQLLFEQSDETIGCPDTAATSIRGLGILPGSITRFSPMSDLKIPHMGWNSLSITDRGRRLFEGIDEEPYVYFVHSYYLKAAERSDVAAVTDYGISFDSAVNRDNIFGCQFHPEKSGSVGLKILDNFCRFK